MEKITYCSCSTGKLFAIESDKRKLPQFYVCFTAECFLSLVGYILLLRELISL